MSAGVGIFFLMLEIAVAVVSFKLVRSRKRAGTKYAPVMMAGIVSSFLAVISVCYLVATGLLLNGIA